MLLIAAPEFPSVAGVPRRTDIRDGDSGEALRPRFRGHHR
jgi:hypothetical protein